MRKIGISIVVILLALLVFKGKLEGFFFKQENIGRVLTVDNSDAIVQGISKIGSQYLNVEILTGEHKGKTLEVRNLLSGSMEYDEFYKEKDKILMVVTDDNGELKGKALSLLRIEKIGGLAFIFVSLLIFTPIYCLFIFIIFLYSVANVLFYFFLSFRFPAAHQL